VAAGKFNVFSMRLQMGDIERTINWVKTKWDKTFPEKVFEYHFLDEQLDQNYGREQRMLTIMKYFSVLAIFISALGLFGLVAYVNHLRAKEVSIRKVQYFCVQGLIRAGAVLHRRIGDIVYSLAYH
jgi:putative ABC transport system permease protein